MSESLASLFLEFLEDWIPFDRALGPGITSSQKNALWALWLTQPHRPRG